ncbi:MAG TPA: hypothetical protein VKX17_23580 [Planctomycetota bacterium]|nr:hypothetical protein [Planctomycetota bacterium]
MLHGLRLSCAALAVVLSARLSATEVVTTLSGDGTLLSDTFVPSFIALDPPGDVFAVGGFGRQLLVVQHGTNKAIVIAGDLKKSGFAGDGGLVTKALFTRLGGIATDSVGNVFVLDGSRIRRVDYNTAVITTIAGGNPGFGGDGGPASAALLNPVCPFSGLAIDQANNGYFADTGNNRIRRIDAKTGIITTVAGNGHGGTVIEGAPALQTPLGFVGALSVDAAGNLYFVELLNVSRVFRIDATTQTVATVAGSGTNVTSGFSGDSGLATNALLNSPLALAIDPAGNLIIADTFNERVRQVDRTTQIITTLAGGGTVAADGCLPKSAVLFAPWGVAYDKGGNLIVADTFGLRLRELIDGSLTDTEDPDGDGFSNVIEQAAGSNLNDPTSTPFLQPSASAIFEHCTVGATFNTAAANKVRLTISGSLPAPAAPAFAGARVICAFGSMTRVFTLDAHGSAHSKLDALHFSYKAKKGQMSFRANIGAADFAQILSTGTTFAVPPNKAAAIGMFVLFQNTIYAGNVDLSFATHGSSGVKVIGMTQAGDFGSISGR